MPKVSFLGFLYILVLLVHLFSAAIFFWGPSLLLLPFSIATYRRWGDFLASSWWTFIVFTVENVFGTKVFISGDNITKSSCVYTPNHRTRLDWFFFWCFMVRDSTQFMKRFKVVLKDPMKKIPMLGWCLQMCCFLFVKRNWEQDANHIKRVLEYYGKTKYPLQIIIFPEGTDLSDSNKEKSQQFAEKNNLQIYEYVLHPRVKGFQLMIQTLRKNKIVDTVYDITIGYPDRIPQNEDTLTNTDFPKEVHFHVKGYSLDEIPEDEEGIANWIKNIWSQKEERLKLFYKEKKFPETENHVCANSSQRTKSTIYLCAIFWIFELFFFLYCFWEYSWVRWISLVGVLVHIFFTHIYGGLDLLELFFYDKSVKSKKFK